MREEKAVEVGDDAMTHKSERFVVGREMKEGLHEAGAIGKRTSREFDEACIIPAAPFSLMRSKLFARRSTYHSRHSSIISTCPRPRFRSEAKQEAAQRARSAVAFDFLQKGSEELA